MKIIRPPYAPRRTPVKTGITVYRSIVAGVPRPEPFGIEMGDCIGRNFFDCSPDSQFTPGVLCKRTMTTEDNHAGGPPDRNPSCSSAEGSKDRTIKRNVSKNAMCGNPTAPFGVTAGIGTKRTNRAGLTMSVDRGRPEVAGRGSNRPD